MSNFCVHGITWKKAQRSNESDHYSVPLALPVFDTCSVIVLATGEVGGTRIILQTSDASLNSRTSESW